MSRQSANRHARTSAQQRARRRHREPPSEPDFPPQPSNRPMPPPCQGFPKPEDWPPTVPADTKAAKTKAADDEDADDENAKRRGRLFGLRPVAGSTPELRKRAREMLPALRLLLRAVHLRFHHPGKRGPKRSLKMDAFCRVLLFHGVVPNHHMVITDIVSFARTLPKPTQRSLGLDRFFASVPPARQYFHFHNALTDLVDELARGWTHTEGGDRQEITLAWFVNTVARAGVPPELLAWPHVAIDGAAWSTYYNLTAGDGEPTDRHADLGDPDDPQAAARRLGPSQPAKGGNEATRKSSPVKLTPIGVGPDGRPRYTIDFDATVGRMSATGKRAACLYCGYEIHVAVAMRAVARRRRIRGFTLGRKVPSVFLGVNLTSAGTDRARAGVALLDSLEEFGHLLAEVAADRAYTMYRYWLYEVLRRGARNVMDLRKDQRSIRPGPGHSVILDGFPFLDLVDDAELDRPSLSTPKETRLAMQRAFKRRALYAYLPNTGDNDVRHFLSPLGTDGRLRPHLRALARELGVKPREEPRAPRGKELEYARGVTLHAPELLTYVGSVFGTDAHHVDYSRRLAVEFAFRYLSNRFTQVGWAHAEVCGLNKHAVLLAFTLAGANGAIVADARRARAVEEAARRRRGKRRSRRRPHLSDRPGPGRPRSPAPGGKSQGRGRRRRAARGGRVSIGGA